MPPHGVPALAGEPVRDVRGLSASLAHPTTLGRVTEIDNQVARLAPRACALQMRAGRRTLKSADASRMGRRDGQERSSGIG